MSTTKNVYYDVVIDMEETMKWGNKELSIYIYTIKHVDGATTLVNLDKKFIRIKWFYGDITLKFHESLDMLRFAKALYDAICDLIIDNKYPIIMRMAEFMKREMV